MAKIKLVLHIIDTINGKVGMVASLLILAIIGVMTFEVIARYGFNAPTDWSFETNGFLLFAYILLGGGYTALCGSHVSTDIFYSHFSLRGKAIWDVLTALFFSFIFVGVMFWFGLEYSLNATSILKHSGTPWNPPIYIVTWALPVGVVLLAIQVLAKFIRDLHICFTGKEL